MDTKEVQPHLPRVLVNARRGYALEVLRGHKFSHVINADSGTISYDRVTHEKLKSEWKEYSTEPAQVDHFAEVSLKSFRPKTERASRTLREIRSMFIDVPKASTQQLIDFYNAHTPEAKRIKKFADRKTAEERVTKLLATLNSAPKGDGDAAVQEEASTSTTTKGKTMSKSKAKSTKTNGKTKSVAATPKKKTGSISSGVKASWANKKVAAARSKKDKVKTGGEIFSSLAKAFAKLKLPMSGFSKFRKELKEKARAVYEGHTFTIYNDPADA